MRNGMDNHYDDLILNDWRENTRAVASCDTIQLTRIAPLESNWGEGSGFTNGLHAYSIRLGYMWKQEQKFGGAHISENFWESNIEQRWYDKLSPYKVLLIAESE